MKVDEPTHLSCDNKSAIAVAYNPEHHIADVTVRPMASDPD